MGKIIISESQLKRLVNRITETAAGYDDIYVMSQHGKHSLDLLQEGSKNLLNVLLGLTKLLRIEDLSIVELKENLMLANGIISEIVRIIEIILNDFTEKDTIVTGKTLLRKLKLFVNRIRPILQFNDEDLNKKQIVSKISQLVESLFDDFLMYSRELRKSINTFNDRFDKFKPKPNQYDN